MKTLFCIGFSVIYVVGRGQDRAMEAREVLQAKSTMHQECDAGDVRFRLCGLYIEEGWLWLVLRATNRSAIDFKPAAMHCTIRDKHSVRRRALQELRLYPVYSDPPVVLRSGTSSWICYAVEPRVPRKHQELVLTWGDRNGDRRLEMHVSGRAVLHARPLSLHDD